MIVEPLNDRECLLKLSQLAAEAVSRPDVQQLAQALGSTTALVAFLRSQPQDDDTGDDPANEVQCDVPQRARILGRRPNCVERTMTYLATAENIDPRPVRRMATVSFPGGRHTYPMENGRVVHLDPAVPRNALVGALPAIRNAQGFSMTPTETLQWISDMAEESADAAQLGRVTRAREAFFGLLDGAGLSRAAVRDVGTALALAKRTAEGLGADAQRAVAVAMNALTRIERAQRPRNLSLGFGGKRWKVKIDWAKARELGSTYAPMAATAALAAYGVPLPVAAAAGQLVASTLKQEESSNGANQKAQQQKQGAAGGASTGPTAGP